MAELDYAFLADYATVVDGKLTAVGASFTHAGVHSFPSLFGLAVAGRVRMPQDVASCRLQFTVTAPSDSYTIQTEMELNQLENTIPYQGRVGVVFAATFIIPLEVPGLFAIDLELEGKPVRRLAFEAIEAAH